VVENYARMIILTPVGIIGHNLHNLHNTYIHFRMLASLVSLGTRLTYMVVSSAYRFIVQWSMQFGRSFMKMMESKGPRMDPCGTPLVTSL